MVSIPKCTTAPAANYGFDESSCSFIHGANHAVFGTVVCSDVVQPRGQHVVCISRNVQDEQAMGTGFCLSMPPGDQSVCLYPDAMVSVDHDDPTANIMFSMKA